MHHLPVEPRRRSGAISHGELKNDQRPALEIIPHGPGSLHVNHELREKFRLITTDAGFNLRTEQAKKACTLYCSFGFRFYFSPVGKVWYSGSKPQSRVDACTEVPGRMAGTAS